MMQIKEKYASYANQSFSHHPIMSESRMAVSIIIVGVFGWVCFKWGRFRKT
jgi:hypothetical protein